MKNKLRFLWIVLQRVRHFHPLGPDEGMYRRMKKAGRVTYGPGSYGLPKFLTFMLDSTGLRVGNYSSIGSTFLLGGRHPVKMVTTYPHRINLGMEGAGEDGIPLPSADTVVGSDCWLCYESLIMTGITIGDGAIVGAGAVVTRDVPPYAIVGGNPAEIIRYRHTAEQREALLEIKWWDWPEDEVREAVPYLASEDIDAFIAYARAKEARKGVTAGPTA